jgi:hypothetical protein
MFNERQLQYSFVFKKLLFENSTLKGLSFGKYVSVNCPIVVRYLASNQIIRVK